MRLEDLRKARTSLRDKAVYARYRIAAATPFLRLLRHGPRIIKDVIDLEWLQVLGQCGNLLEMSCLTRTGKYREANAYAMYQAIAGVGDLLNGMYSSPDRIVIHEDLVPPEILFAMGLAPWMAEFLGMALPMVQADWAEKYIDTAENDGAPPDTCSLPKCTMGLALDGQFPKPAAIVTSNMPCDGGMSSYTVMEKKLDSPIYRVDIPFNFHTDRAVRYFVAELEKMIAWLEAHTPGRMDWDRLKDVCEQRNKAAEYELELWDLMRKKPSPMAGEPIWFSHLVHMLVAPGQERGTQAMKRLVEISREIVSSQGGALPEERYRTVLWNPPTVIFPDLFVWAEQTYGVATLMDMLTFNRHPFIDTRSPESMLAGLARIIMEGPMARHTRGPAANFFEDLFHLCEDLSLDMVWMAGHIGCKNTMALNGMLREKCRQRNIPLLIINYDLSDTRIVSPVEMRKQVEVFMETVMKASPIAKI